MSITEVDSILRLGLPHDDGRGIGAAYGYGLKTWKNGSLRITEVSLRANVPVVFWTDLVTQQARVFVDSKLSVEEGNLSICGGGEIAPPEWN